MVDTEFHNRTGGHVNGVAFLKFRDAFLVHVCAVFDRVTTGAEGGHDPVLAVAVGGDDATGAVGFVDDGPELGIGELLAQRVIRNAENTP